MTNIYTDGLSRIDNFCCSVVQTFEPDNRPVPHFTHLRRRIIRKGQTLGAGSGREIAI
jgi:hypothetical protein